MLQIQQRKEESVFDACTRTERQSNFKQDLNTSALYDLLEEITSVNSSEETFEFQLPFETRDKVYKAKQTDNGDRTTLKKGGTAPPEITLKELVQKLSLYVKKKPDLKKVTNAIERKYRIQTLDNDLWPIDDIKRAWGKTQRIDENHKGAWTFVLMYQVMKTYERQRSQLLDKLERLEPLHKKMISRPSTSHASSPDQCDIGSTSQQSSSTENSEKSQPQGDITESHDNTEEIVNAPACLRKNYNNGKRTTLKKGGTAPPEITLKELVQKLSLHVKQKPDLKKVTNAIERKYRIQTLDNDLWPIDDIKRAWGKTQRIHENQKGAWTFVIMYQVMKTYERERSQLLDKLVWLGHLYKKMISRTNTSRVSSLDQCDIGSASQQSSSTENSEKSQPQGDISESHDNTEEIVNAPACLRKNYNNGKRNGSHVMEKMTEVKNSHQPEQVAVNTSGVTSELPLPSETRDKMLKAKQTVHVERTTLQDLQSHVTIKSDPIKLKKAIEKIYEIQKQKNDSWPINDIKQAWRKTQRMHGYSKRRKIRALAVTLQILQSKEVSMYDTSTMTETQCNLKQDLTTSTSDDFNKKYIYKPEQYAPNTSEVTPEFSLAKNVKSMKRSLSPVQQKLIGISKRELKNLKYQGGMQKTNLALFLKHIKYEPSQTTYIRIPLSIMTEELNVGRNVGSHAYSDANIENLGYKLIDEVPSFANTMKKTSYVVKYDHRTRNAAWVFEILNKETLIKASKRQNRFKLDDSIHEYFRGPKKLNEELQRGHLAAAANHKWSQKAMDDTFLFSNISPQHGSLNKKCWSDLEDYCRKYITDEICTNVYVYTGPLYCPDEGKDEFQYKIVGELEKKDFKAKPTHFFKVIILEYTDGTRTLECYVMPNENTDNKKSENEKRQQEYFLRMSEFFSQQEQIRSEENLDKLDKLWNTHGRKLFLYKKNLEDIERASGLLFREESLSQDYEEQRVEVNWSAVQEDKHASANVTIYRPTQSHMSGENLLPYSEHLEDTERAEENLCLDYEEQRVEVNRSEVQDDKRASTEVPINSPTQSHMSGENLLPYNENLEDTERAEENLCLDYEEQRVEVNRSEVQDNKHASTEVPINSPTQSHMSGENLLPYSEHLEDIERAEENLCLDYEEQRVEVSRSEVQDDKRASTEVPINSPTQSHMSGENLLPYSEHLEDIERAEENLCLDYEEQRVEVNRSEVQDDKRASTEVPINSPTQSHMSGENLLPYNENLEDTERAEENLSQDYEEQRVEVNRSEVQDDKRASTEVPINRPTQS